MLLSFLAALLRALGRRKREAAEAAPPPAEKSPGPDDWLAEGAAPAPAKYPSFPNYSLHGYLHFEKWLDCSRSTNVEALRYRPGTEELDVVYHGGTGKPTSGWTYGGVDRETAYEIGNAEALGVTPLGNPSTSGKGVKVWDRLRLRGPGNFHAHQVPARRNDGLIAEYLQGRRA